MNARCSRARAPWLFLAIAAVALLLAGGVLQLWPSSPQPPRAAARATATPVHEPAPALEYASDGLPIKPSDPRVPMPDGPMHPHPITPAHERIYRENNLVGALNLAVDLEDPARVRELVAQYRAEYPEDEHRLQDGYAIIADCLEHLDDEVRARARRFWETEIRSQTRRYVRRYCLER